MFQGLIKSAAWPISLLQLTIFIFMSWLMSSSRS